MIILCILMALLGYSPTLLAFWHAHTILSVLLLIFFA